MMQFEQEQSFQLQTLLMKSTALSKEQKHLIKTHNFQVVDGCVVINNAEHEVIASPSPKQMTESKVMQHIYGLTKSQQRYVFFLVHEEKENQAGNRKLKEIIYCEETIAKHLKVSSKTISRANKTLTGLSFLTIESKKRKNGSNSTNSYTVPEYVFEVLKNKQFSDVCPKSHKETNLFFEKMSRPKGQNVQAIISLSKKEYRSFGSASTDPLGLEKKEPPRKAKELSLWMPKELEKRLGLTENESALISQAKTLLKNNGNDLGKAKKQYRVLLEVVKDLNIRNKKGWLQTAIDKNFEFKEEESEPTTPTSPSTHQKQKTPEVTLQEKSAIKEIVQVIKKLSLANRISPKMPFIWLRRFGGLERILNALWAVFEQIRKGNEIKNPEAYITKAIQEGYKPKNHTVEEYRTIYRNMEELERRIPQLKAKGIDVTKQKIYIDKKLRWEIVLNRKNICDGIADLHIAIINPRLGELIAGFEQKHDAEQNNISENEGWLKETVKELEQTYEKLKTKRTTTGYRLMMPAEMISNGQTHRFIDHVELKTANPRAVLEGDLQGFLERNHLGASSW